MKWIDALINLFRSYEQKDDRPPKEEDYKSDELSDQFGIHKNSFSLEIEIDCLFSEDDVLNM
jgi:hypothetical protein